MVEIAAKLRKDDQDNNKGAWNLCKREKFAVSLRKEKKKQILLKRRVGLQSQI